MYKPQTIERMAEHFLALCRAITATPTAKIRDLDYVSEGEKQRVLIEYNDTGAEYPQDKCACMSCLPSRRRFIQTTRQWCVWRGTTDVWGA